MDYCTRADDVKILKMPKKKLDHFASILGQNREIHAPME